MMKMMTMIMVMKKKMIKATKEATNLKLLLNLSMLCHQTKTTHSLSLLLSNHNTLERPSFLEGNGYSTLAQSLAISENTATEFHSTLKH